MKTRYKRVTGVFAQLAKMSIDPKSVELTPDVVRIFLLNSWRTEHKQLAIGQKRFASEVDSAVDGCRAHSQDLCYDRAAPFFFLGLLTRGAPFFTRETILSKLKMKTYEQT